MTLPTPTPSPLVAAAAALPPLAKSLAASWQGDSGTAAHGALQLAGQVVSALAADDGKVQKALSEGVAKVMAAGKDLIAIANAAFNTGAAIVGGSIAAGPVGWFAAAGKVQALITKALAAMKKRLEVLATELAGPTQTLLQLSGTESQNLFHGGTSADSGSSISPTTSGAANTTQPVNFGGVAENAGAGAPTPQAQKAVQKALSAVGTPYQWGGNTPGVGLDCSGLTSWAYREAGLDIPRVANSQTVGRQVTADSLFPGDLLVWEGHVAMYVGGGQIVEAGDPVQTNPVRTSNMGMAFKGYWRPTG